MSIYLLYCLITCKLFLLNNKKNYEHFKIRFEYIIETVICRKAEVKNINQQLADLEAKKAGIVVSC